MLVRVYGVGGSWATQLLLGIFKDHTPQYVGLQVNT